MEYTIQKLSHMAGVSTRTLRYYDEIGLLKPARISSSGYRIYGPNQVDLLQQILFYREVGVGLDGINKLLNSKDFDETKALKEHRTRLFQKREQLDTLIENVEKSIAQKEGRIVMNDKEKFEGFKEKQIEENERNYGDEIREKYGENAVEKSNAKFRNMTKEQFDEVERLGTEVLDILYKALETGDPAGELAQKTADLHRQWLCYFWDSYSGEAHIGLAQMYVDDPRFTAFYDKKQQGSTKFLRDAIQIYVNNMR